MPELYDVYIRDYKGDQQKYEDINTITLNTSADGSTTEVFTAGEAQEKNDIALDMASGDQIITPDSNKLLTQVTVKKPSTLISSNIRNDVTIGGVTGNLVEYAIEASKTVTPNETQQTVTPSPNYDAIEEVVVEAIPSNYVGTGVTRKSAQTYTPGTASQTIAADQYLTGAQTIEGDPDLVATNIKRGETIFGVTGTYGGERPDYLMSIGNTNIAKFYFNIEYPFADINTWLASLTYTEIDTQQGKEYICTLGRAEHPTIADKDWEWRAVDFTRTHPGLYIISLWVDTTLSAPTKIVFYESVDGNLSDKGYYGRTNWTAGWEGWYEYPNSTSMQQCVITDVINPPTMVDNLIATSSVAYGDHWSRYLTTTIRTLTEAGTTDITPSAPYKGFSSVTVNTGNLINPTGTYNVTENGTYNVRTSEYVDVNVASESSLPNYLLEVGQTAYTLYFNQTYSREDIDAYLSTLEYSPITGIESMEMHSLCQSVDSSYDGWLLYAVDAAAIQSGLYCIVVSKLTSGSPTTFNIVYATQDYNLGQYGSGSAGWQMPFHELEGESYSPISWIDTDATQDFLHLIVAIEPNIDFGYFRPSYLLNIQKPVSKLYVNTNYLTSQIDTVLAGLPYQQSGSLLFCAMLTAFTYTTVESQAIPSGWCIMSAKFSDELYLMALTKVENGEPDFSTIQVLYATQDYDLSQYGLGSGSAGWQNTEFTIPSDVSTNLVDFERDDVNSLFDNILFAQMVIPPTQTKSITLGANTPPNSVTPDTGYTLSSVSIGIDSNVIKGENIKKGATILGVSGTHEGGATFVTPYEYASSTISSYSGDAIAVLANAFDSCSYLTTVSLPKCNYIDNSAFSCCTMLTNIYLPECKVLGEYAFAHCSYYLTSLNLPEVTTICNSAFNGCNNLKTINLPKLSIIKGDGVKFYGCNNLESLYLPNIHSLYNFGCSGSSTTLYIEGIYDAKYNRYYADLINYTSSYGTSKIALMSNGSVVGYNTFYANSTNLSVQGVYSRSGFAYGLKLDSAHLVFSYSGSRLNTNIASAEFNNWVSASEIKITGAVQLKYNVSWYWSNSSYCDIGYRAFQNCGQLKELKILFNDTIRISAYAFDNCTKLESLYLVPMSLTSSLAITSINSNTFSNTPMASSSYLGRWGSIYAPSSIITMMKTRPGWSRYSSRMVSLTDEQTQALIEELSY